MSDKYFLEGDNETARLEQKTDKQAVIEQAKWAGLSPGMRILDVGCGPGLTTATLAWASQPDSKAVGIDLSEDRIAYAKEKYASSSIEFHCRSAFDDLSDLGPFDFIWVRFLLEYYAKEARRMVSHLSRHLNKNGILCLIDLDNNPLTHYGMPEPLEKKMLEISEFQRKYNNFDPYAGRKLTDYLYDTKLVDFDVHVGVHHLIHGKLKEVDRLNWWNKLERMGEYPQLFEDYEGGYDGFLEDAKAYFTRPDRFFYTPLVIAKGVNRDIDPNNKFSGVQPFPEDDFPES